MPFFRVVLHGTGIRFMIAGSAKPAIGFYTSRRVRAGSAEEAIAKARRSVSALWTREDYVRANSGDLPFLSTDAIEQVTFWEAWRIPNAGHTFYDEE
jgi:hypothetical protein